MGVTPNVRQYKKNGKIEVKTSVEEDSGSGKIFGESGNLKSMKKVVILSKSVGGTHP